MMLDATRNYQQPLTAEHLFSWNGSLFPTGHGGIAKIRTGAWRDDASGPMQVVSVPIGREEVHYEAPGPATRKRNVGFSGMVHCRRKYRPSPQAGLAHLWFVTIHPFDDGNGRIARAIADVQLARSEASPQRFYSTSAQIRQERKDYYEHSPADARREYGPHALDGVASCVSRTRH